MKKTKRLLAVLLAFAMVVSMLPGNYTRSVSAAEQSTIQLGEETWSADNTTYTFKNVSVSFPEAEQDQKIFCLSVDNGGWFILPDDFTLGTGSTMTGLDTDNEYQADVDNSMKLTSLTVIGTKISDSQIKTFLENVTFYRGDADKDDIQNVSVVSSSVSLPGDNSTAMAIDGKLHFYQYVKFADGDTTSSWYDAYAAAKSDAHKFQGMKGYLATITSNNEENYLYNALGSDLRAWIGGARTQLPTDGYTGFTLDEDAIADNALKPVEDDDTTQISQWTWLCGPEAGTAFYDGVSAPGTVITYADWNRKSSNEPNNTRHNEYSGKTDYVYEYALEYGFNGANWNDFNPYTTDRSSWGISGYLIEWSPYTTSGKDGVADVDNRMETEPATDQVPVYVTKPSLSAGNLVLSKAEAAALTEAKAKELADVKGSYNESTADASSSRITADSDELDAIRAGKSGESFSLTYTYQYDDTDPSLTKDADTTVYITDTANNGTGTSGSKVSLGANNVSISTAELAACADEAAVKELIKSKAAPVGVADGKDVATDAITEDTDVTYPVTKKTGPGTYDVTYVYDGVKTTIQVTVTTEVDSVEADDFIIYTGSDDQTTDDILKKSSAKAKDAADNDITDQVTSWDVPDGLDDLNNALKGTDETQVDLIISADGVATIITATVKPRATIDADSFIITAEDAAKADDALIKDLAKVSGTEEGTAYTTDKAQTDSTKLDQIKNASAGDVISDVTFSHTDSKGSTWTSDKVNAYVVDDKGSHTDSLGSTTTIGAKNVTLTTDEIKNLSDAEIAALIRERAKVIALTDGVKEDDANISANAAGTDTITASTKAGDYNASYVCKDAVTTIKVTVVDSNPVVKVTAGPFTVVRDPSATLTPDSLKDKASAGGLNAAGDLVPGAELTVDADDLAKVNDAIKNGPSGDYTVKISSGDAEPTTITVTVRDRNISVKANDFILTEDEAKAIGSKKDVIKAANANGTDEGASYDYTSDKLDILDKALDEIRNASARTTINDILFIYTDVNGSKTSASADATIVEHKTENVPAATTIGANDVTLTTTELAQLGTNEAIAAKIKELSGVVAVKDGARVSFSDITTAEGSYVLTKDTLVGAYTVIYEYNGVKQAITVTVTGKNPVTKADADPVTVTIGSDPVTADDLLKDSNATAKDGAGNTVPDADLTLDSDAVDRVNDAIKNGPAGVIEVPIKDGDNVIGKISVTVKESVAKVSANDFILSLDDIGSITSDDAVKKADATYTDENGVTDNGEGVKISQDSLDAINSMTEPGTLDVTFVDTKTGKVTGTSTVTVVKNRRTDLATEEIVLGANDFCITIEQAKTIVLKQDQTDVQEMLKILGNACATDNGTWISSINPDIKVIASNIKAEKGVYDVIYTYKDKVNQIKVTVKDHGSADATSSETTVPEINLTANDFAAGKDTTSISETEFKSLAEVVAKYNDGSSVKDVTVDPDDLAKLNERIAARDTGVAVVKVSAVNAATGKTVSTIVHVSLYEAPATPTPVPATSAPATTAPATTAPATTAPAATTPTAVPAPSNTPSIVDGGVSIDEIIKNLHVDQDTAERIKQYVDGNNISMDTLKITDEVVKKIGNDNDIKGSSFSRLKARAIRSTKSTITLKWVKQSGADGYIIYGNQCNNHGKKYFHKHLKTIKGANKLTWTQKNRKKGKYYKYLVVAYKEINGHKITIAAAPIIHATTTGGSKGMAKAVKIKKIGRIKKAKKITLTIGESVNIKASEVKAQKNKPIMKHRKLAYESGNTQVATVTKSGKIKAVSSGTCKIWVYAQNGVYKEITVTVK